MSRDQTSTDKGAKDAPAEAPMPPRPIFVKWLDSVRHADGWYPQSDYVRDATTAKMTHFTLGYLIHETEDALLVAQSITERQEPDHAVADCMQIPKVAVVERKYVEDNRKAKRGQS